MRDYTGRGPTRARTTIRDNIVVVMLEQTLTKAEQSLVAKGRSEKVLEMRHEYRPRSPGERDRDDERQRCPTGSRL
ncbi:MAG: DUF2294 domain-containing protein [Actinomycetota bacterium]|nr:DUF2294 domain-containing protein [Actinomycetota bacterium]